MGLQRGGPAVVLFDGACDLCNGTVRFITARDRAGRFRFTSLQSDAGRALLARCGLAEEGERSVVLVEGDRCYTRSTAVLRIARRLGPAWALVSLLLLVPAPLRDRVYDWVARNRRSRPGESCPGLWPGIRKRPGDDR